MINHDVTHWIPTERIIPIRRLRLAATKTHVANDHVMRVELDGISRDANAISWGRVARDGDVGCADADGGFQADDARYIENDDARTSLFTSIAKTARTAVIEIGNDDDFTAPAAEGIHATAPGARKRGDFRLWQIRGFRGTGNVGFPFRGPRFNFGQGAGESFIGKFACGGPFNSGCLHDISRNLRITLGVGI